MFEMRNVAGNQCIMMVKDIELYMSATLQKQGDPLFLSSLKKIAYEKKTYPIIFCICLSLSTYILWFF